LQHLLAYMLLFHYHGLWCPVYCWGWFCQFELYHHHHHHHHLGISSSGMLHSVCSRQPIVRTWSVKQSKTF
jgi:hypothetical protein